MPHRRVIRTERLRQPIASFSHAVRRGDLVFVGAKGSVAAGQRGAIHAGDVAAQAAQAIGNARTALEELGSRLEDTVELRVWLQDWRYRAAVDAAIDALVPAPALARSTSFSPAFPFPAFMVEFDLIAAVASHERERIVGRRGAAGVRAGDLLLLEQVTGVGGGHAGDPGPVPDEASRALERVRENVASAGAGDGAIVRVTASLADLRDVPSFLAAWRRALPAPRPPLVLVGSSPSDPAARVEVGAIASRAAVRYVPLGSGAAREESAAAVAGGLVFTAGSDAAELFGAMPDRASGDPTEELVRCLRLAGAGPEDVLRTYVAVADWRHYERSDEGYRRLFTPPYPARTTVQAHLPGARAIAQLDAIAGADRMQHDVLVSA